MSKSRKLLLFFILNVILVSAVMKKLLVGILIFFAFAFSAFGVFCPKLVSYAENTTDTVETEIFLPTTYLQYYKLESPYAICRETMDGKEFVAISHKGAIVVYSDGNFKKIDISSLLPDAAQGVPSLQLYDKYLLFSAQLKLYAVNVDEVYSSDAPVRLNTVSSTDGQIVVCNDFSICGDKLAVTTNTDILYYDVSSDENGLILARRAEKISINYSSAVMLSKNGRTYYYDDDRKQISEHDGENTRKIVDAKGVKAIAESPDEKDKNIYYSCSEGIFSADVSMLSPVVQTIMASSFASDGDKDLGYIWKPQGICVTGKGIWVVDSDINAVQEIDLTKRADGTYGFTDFAITTNSRAVNRLSENASEITVTDNTVYALDENRIVIIENADGEAESRKYHRLTLPVAANRFAIGSVGKKSEKTVYIAYSYSNGKKISFGKISQSADDENIYELTEIPVENISETETGAIVDICFMNGVFYVLKNTSPDSDGGVYPVVYEINTGDETPKLKESFRISDKCTAKRIAVDVFDCVYIAALNEADGEYVFYSRANGVLKRIYGFSASGRDLLKMQVDLDGKLYILTDRSGIIGLYPSENYSTELNATVIKSPNLEGVGAPRSMCLNEQSRSAYFIFGGLILRSSVEEQLDIATLDTMRIPEDFSTVFSEETTFGKPTVGAKLFGVNATKLNGKYFAYLGMNDADEEHEYAFVRVNDRFSLAIRRGLAAIVRNEDIEAASGYDTENLSYYALVDFKLYDLPVLEAAYSTEKTVTAKSSASIVGKLVFNGDEYYVIETTDGKGYIPVSFLTDKLSESEISDKIESAYLYNKNGVILYDDELKNTGRALKGEIKVEIKERNGEYVKVKLESGEEYYVLASDVKTSSNDNFIKCIVAILCASSFLVLALFFERKYLFSAT